MPILKKTLEYIVATSAANENEKILNLLNVIIAANQYSIDVEDILLDLKRRLIRFLNSLYDYRG
jgi:hypothetical protein